MYNIRTVVACTVSERTDIDIFSAHVYSVSCDTFQDQRALSPGVGEELRKSGQASPGDQRAEAAGTMHNVIIPSGRVQNRPVRKSVVRRRPAASGPARKRCRAAQWRCRVVEGRKSACIPRGRSDASDGRSLQRKNRRRRGGNCDKYLASRLTTLFPLINHAS